MQQPNQHGYTFAFEKYLTLRNAWIVFLCFLGLITGVQCITAVYDLATDNYTVRESDLYRIDSFRMQDRVYAAGGGKSGSRMYYFSSQNGYSFVIEGAAYKGIIDRAELYDTLLYHGMTFTVFSDLDTYNTYKNEKTPFGIIVLQIQIGNKKYIDLAKANGERKKKMVLHLMWIPLLCLFIYIYRKMSAPDKKEEQKEGRKDSAFQAGDH